MWRWRNENGETEEEGNDNITSSQPYKHINQYWLIIWYIWETDMEGEVLFIKFNNLILLNHENPSFTNHLIRSFFNSC